MFPRACTVSTRWVGQPLPAACFAVTPATPASIPSSPAAQPTPAAPAPVNPALVPYARTLNLMATLRHNAAVHLLADAFRKLSKEGGSTLLVNAGKAPPADVQQAFVDANLSARDTITVRGRSSGQDNTVPPYLLPDYPGRPDLMLIKGWCELDPAVPPSPIPSAPDCRPPTLIPIELCYAQDDCPEFMRAAIERKWRKYQGLPELSAHHAPSSPSSLIGRDLLRELRARVVAGRCWGNTRMAKLTSRVPSSSQLQ